MNSDFFTEVATIERFSTFTRGNGGEIIETWTSQFDINGSFQKTSGEWTIVDGQRAFRKERMFYCDIADIYDKDRLIINSRTYEIREIQNVFNHHLEIELEYRSTSSAGAS